MERVERMTTGNSLADHRLMAWLSPAYPIGSYSYSHGLEQAISSGVIKERDSLFQWLHQILFFGSGRNDAIFLANAYKASKKNLKFLGFVAEAFSSSKERHLESLEQGEAFSRVTSAVNKLPLPRAPLPIVVGYAAREQNIELNKLLPLYIHAFSANLISAAVRFLPLGQTDGQIVLTNLFPYFDNLANQTRDLTIHDLRNSCFLGDIASMKHENLDTRIFRS